MNISTAAKLSLCLIALNLAIASQNAFGDDSPFKTDREKTGYAIGMNVGLGVERNLKSEKVDANLSFLVRGFKDTVTGGSTLLKTEELPALFEALKAGKFGHTTNSAAADAKQADAPDAPIKTDQDKVGYAIGMRIGGNIGKNLKAGGVDADPASLVKGFKDTLTGAPTLLKKEELQPIFQHLQAQQMAKIKEEGEKNLKAGADFLAKNKSEPGVITLPDGLQYKILKSGPATAEKPTKSSSVKVHYHGTLIDGTVFDSSVQRGEPATFGVSGVIPGWTEALQLMRVGDKWKLFIPSELAYGEHGFPPSIAPNAVLIFEVELLEIEK